MARPDVQRYGDMFSLNWKEIGYQFNFSRIHDSKYGGGLRSEVQVMYSKLDPPMPALPPLILNLHAIQDQSRLADLLSERVNGLPKKEWHTIVLQACSIVTREWRTSNQFVSLDQMDPEVRVSYLIPGLIPEHETTVLYGDGASSKSLLSLFITTCVQYGVTLPWGVTPKQANVMYLDWETTPKTMAVRCRRLAEGMGMERPPILYLECHRPLVDLIPYLREQVIRNSIGLVVVDSIGFAANGSLTEDQTARETMNALRIFENTTRLVVAHVSKSDADLEKGKAKPFGSAFFWNAS